MDKLTLYSFNVRGLKSDINKRRKIFELFKKKLNGIIFLQETHRIPEIALHGNTNGEEKLFSLTAHLEKRAEQYYTLQILIIK